MMDPFITNHVEYVRSGGVTLGADAIAGLAPGLGIGAWPDATDEAGTLGTGRAPGGTVHGSRSWPSYVIEQTFYFRPWRYLSFSFLFLSFPVTPFFNVTFRCSFRFCLPVFFLSFSLSYCLSVFVSVPSHSPHSPFISLSPSSSLFPFTYFLFPFSFRLHPLPSHPPPSHILSSTPPLITTSQVRPQIPYKSPHT